MPIDFDKFKTLPGLAFNSLTPAHTENRGDQKYHLPFTSATLFQQTTRGHIFFSQCSQFNF